MTSVETISDLIDKLTIYKNEYGDGLLVYDSGDFCSSIFHIIKYPLFVPQNKIGTPRGADK
jgi:hypothetical protein